jgi:quinol-cytochrome oxidoreductase complex cytochrome b subunit
MTEEKKNLFGRIGRSIVRGAVSPRTGRDRRRPVFENLILHIHPRTVPEKTLRLSLTWGLGGSGVVLVLLLALTGVLLLFAYEPTPEKAYSSILTINEDIPFGRFVRNVHHWSANLLVIIAFLHLLRIFFTGAYHDPRQFNWVIGLMVLFSVLLANFTGYLMPWDQLAYWAITICTSMLEYVPLVGMSLQKALRGGEETGPATLLVFFAIHNTVVPVLLIILLPFHFWRVRKAGGAVIPRAPGEEPDTAPLHVPTVPNLVTREVTAAAVLVACVFVFSLFVNAPLAAPANPGMSPNPAKAPWYFLGLQELLLHFHPFFAVFLFPLLMTAGLVLLPYIRYDATAPGVWFLSEKGRRIGAAATAAALLATLLFVLADEFVLDIPGWLPSVPAVVSNGLLPTAILAALVAVFYAGMKRRYGASRGEAIQALFILLVVSFVVLTAVGIWFRGSGMALAWPWM